MLCKEKKFTIESLFDMPSRSKAKEILNGISPELKDLFEKIFVYDPDKRITFSDIYNHPWINKS